MSQTPGSTQAEPHERIAQAAARDPAAAGSTCQVTQGVAAQRAIDTVPW